MNSKKEIVLIYSLAFVSMMAAGLILYCYENLGDAPIDKASFNNILLKSFVISAAVTGALYIFNYKKYKAKA